MITTQTKTTILALNCLKMLGIGKGHVTRKWHALVVYLSTYINH